MASGGARMRLPVLAALLTAMAWAPTALGSQCNSTFLVLPTLK